VKLEINFAQKNAVAGLWPVMESHERLDGALRRGYNFFP
jgi:hypothetical protein